jgi:hypothetical protein
MHAAVATSCRYRSGRAVSDGLRVKAACSSHKLITRKLLSLGYLHSLGRRLRCANGRGAGQKASKGRYGVTWVINASVGCAFGVLAGAFGIVLGDDGLRSPGASVCSPPISSTR